MARKVTIRDVAEHCGYSIYTVSCVLNNKGSISEATRRKVQQAIRRLNYDPLRNIPLARNLAAKTLALVAPDFYSEDHPFFSTAVGAARSFASRHEYDMKLFTVADFTARVAANRRRSQTLGFDRLVVFCCEPSAADIRDVADRGVPVAMVRRELEHPGVIVVMDDDRRGVELAMEHLHVHHGHSRIGVLASEFHEGVPAVRREAYLHYLRTHGLPEDRRLQIDMAALTEPLGRRLEPLIRSGELTALVCMEDGLAVQAAKTLLRRGFRIGSDIALTGYNNTRDVDLFYPGVTSVEVPVAKMVGAACQALAAYDQDVAPASTVLRFENRLVVRESCGCRLDDDADE